MVSNCLTYGGSWTAARVGIGGGCVGELAGGVVRRGMKRIVGGELGSFRGSRTAAMILWRRPCGRKRCKGERAVAEGHGKKRGRREKGKNGGSATSRPSSTFGSSGAARGAAGCRGTGATIPSSWWCVGERARCGSGAGGEWCSVEANWLGRPFYSPSAGPWWTRRGSSPGLTWARRRGGGGVASTGRCSP